MTGCKSIGTKQIGKHSIQMRQNQFCLVHWLEPLGLKAQILFSNATINDRNPSLSKWGTGPLGTQNGKTPSKSSTFGSKFVAMKISLEMNAAIGYKFRMMGVPIQGHLNTFGDNASVIKNVTFPKLTLHKCHNSIEYCNCCKDFVGGAVSVAHESWKENCSDSLTKCMAGPAFHAFTRSVLLN
jgi:hypothetical protein